MERLQNPFSVYDFLGYLIPGALAIYCFLLILAPENVEWNTVLEHYKLDEAEMFFPFTIMSYVTGHIISFLSSITVENYSVWSLGYPSKYLLHIPYQGYWNSAKKESVKGWEKFVRFASRFFMGLLLLPISLLDYLFGNLCHARYLFARKLDTFTKQVIEENLNSGFKYVTDIGNLDKVGDADNENFFRVIYHFCLENVNVHQNKFQNYIALYGFLRALSFLFVMIFWGILFLSETYSQFIICGFFGLTSYIAYMGYNKFSRRFSLEVFMAYVTIVSSRKNADQFNYTETGDWFTEWVN